MTETVVTRGAHHIGLTVPDLAETRAFFVDTLGFNQVGEVRDYPAVFMTDGTTIITLWQWPIRQTRFLLTARTTSVSTISH